MQRKRPQHIDLSDFARNGQQPERRISFAGEIIAIASLLPQGEVHSSAIACRRRPSRRPCGGRLDISREGADGAEDEVRWSCPSCGDTGLITGWHDTRWDRSPELKSGQIVSLFQVRAQRAGRICTAQPTRAFDLLVELVAGPLELGEAVTRKLRIGGNRTLHELHQLVQRSFDRDEEEPYEFMFGAPYDPDSRRFAGGIIAAEDEDDDPWETQSVTLDSLELAKGQTFGYLFDFGEEWVHRVTVTAIGELTERGVRARVLERRGTSPPQYSDIDDLWEGDLLWTEFDDEYPLSGLYGPYDADEEQDAEHWTAMEDLERLLLVIESHAQSLSKGHEPVMSMPLHAVVHYLAESGLAKGDQRVREHVEARRRKGATRHQAIHEIGEAMIRELLPARAGAKRRSSES